MTAVWLALALALMAMAVAAHLYFLPFRLGPAPEFLLDGSFFSNPAQDTSGVKLLVDGEEAFGAVLAAIGSARQSVHIQTFIWKDDILGNRMAEAALAAADRGVAVTISKDALGTFFELARKEGRLGVVFTSAALRSHPNIRVDTSLAKPVDHSKYFIMDGKSVIFGGMNIADEYHLKWHDYMIGLEDPALARAFAEKVLYNHPWPPAGAMVIATNTRNGAQIRTGMAQLISFAQKRLMIEHAYFSADIILDALEAAMARGVEVDLVLPRDPATHGPANQAAVNRLLASPHSSRLRAFFYPRMTHAKVMVADGRMVAIGSANMTFRSLYVSGETALFAHFRPDHPFMAKLHDRLEKDIQISQRIGEPFVLGAMERARALAGKYIW